MMDPCGSSNLDLVRRKQGPGDSHRESQCTSPGVRFLGGVALEDPPGKGGHQMSVGLVVVRCLWARSGERRCCRVAMQVTSSTPASDLSGIFTPSATARNPVSTSFRTFHNAKVFHGVV